MVVLQNPTKISKQSAISPAGKGTPKRSFININIHSVLLDSLQGGIIFAVFSQFSLLQFLVNRIF